jgi:glycosyltransferase involved in cell wall biosynthesis
MWLDRPARLYLARADQFMTLPLLLAAAILLGWLFIGQEIFRGLRRVRWLARLPLPATGTWPRVSVVFAARNEAATLGAAVPTMLALDYPDWELIAVNDRSEDATGAILDQLAQTDTRLKVVHVTALPEGWLGKNHALADGAAVATGEWILFTDADIHFQPEVLRRAIAYARAQTLDHLAAVPALGTPGHWLGICINAFSFGFCAWLRPWKIADPRSRAHGGVGAFNLVRAATYRKLGGHVPVHLRPDDDIKLGKLMKSGGFSDFVFGAGAISVAWYATVGEMIRGLEKNAYAAVDYRWWVPPLGLLALATGVVWPLVALFVTTGPAWWCYAGTVAVMLALGCDQSRFTGGRRWHGLFLPAGLVVIVATMLRSTAVTLWTGGIRWRGTFYPLRELKRNRL